MDDNLTAAAADYLNQYSDEVRQSWDVKNELGCDVAEPVHPNYVQGGNIPEKHFGTVQSMSAVTAEEARHGLLKVIAYLLLHPPAEEIQVHILWKIMDYINNQAILAGNSDLGKSLGDYRTSKNLPPTETLPDDASLVGDDVDDADELDDMHEDVKLGDEDGDGGDEDGDGGDDDDTKTNVPVDIGLIKTDDDCTSPPKQLPKIISPDVAMSSTDSNYSSVKNLRSKSRIWPGSKLTRYKQWKEKLSHDEESETVFDVGKDPHKPVSREDLDRTQIKHKRRFKTTPKRVRSTPKREKKLTEPVKAKTVKVQKYKRKRKCLHHCRLCDISFDSNKELRKHKEGHRHHLCTVCGRGFAYNTYLLRHMVVHSKPKPHVCKFCKEKFDERDQLLEHAKTHVGKLDTFICHKYKYFYITNNTIPFYH